AGRPRDPLVVAAGSGPAAATLPRPRGPRLTPLEACRRPHPSAPALARSCYRVACQDCRAAESRRWVVASCLSYSHHLAYLDGLLAGEGFPAVDDDLAVGRFDLNGCHASVILLCGNYGRATACITVQYPLSCRRPSIETPRHQSDWLLCWMHTFIVLTLSDHAVPELSVNSCWTTYVRPCQLTICERVFDARIAPLVPNQPRSRNGQIEIIAAPDDPSLRKPLEMG